MSRFTYQDHTAVLSVLSSVKTNKTDQTIFCEEPSSTGHTNYHQKIQKNNTNKKLKTEDRFRGHLGPSRVQVGQQSSEDKFQPFKVSKNWPKYESEIVMLFASVLLTSMRKSEKVDLVLFFLVGCLRSQQQARVFQRWMDLVTWCYV